MFRKQSVFTAGHSVSLCRRSFACLCISFLLSGPVFAALQIEEGDSVLSIHASVEYDRTNSPRVVVYKPIELNQVDYEHAFAGLSENKRDNLGDGYQDYFVQGDSIIVTSHDLTANYISSSFFMQGSANEYANTWGMYDFGIPFTITGETTLVHFSYDVLTSSQVNLDPPGLLDLEISRDDGGPGGGETIWATYRKHNTANGPPSGQPIDETDVLTFSLEPGDYSLTMIVEASKNEGTDSSYGAFYFGDTPGSVPQIPQAPISIDLKPSDPDNYVETEGDYSDRVYVRAFSTVDFDASQIDPPTLKLGITGAPVVSTQTHDPDNDGDDDLTARFRIAQTGIVCENPEANIELSGETYAGEKFVAIDYVTTPDCPTSCHP
jgi:hypothetical protein